MIRVPYLKNFFVIFYSLIILNSCADANANDAYIIPTQIINNQAVEIPLQQDVTQNSQAYTKPIEKLTCDPLSIICIKSYTLENSIKAEIFNQSDEGRTARVKLWSKNVNIDQKVPDLESIYLKGGEKKDLLHLKQADLSQSYGFNFNFDSLRGKLEAKHDDSFVYSLPYETNKAYKVVQSYGGRFSHLDEQNYYSYDFRMPSGTPIAAARGGVVIEVVEKYRYGGRNRKMREKSNYIYIEHDDGTIAVYDHLLNGGAISNVGDKIQMGQVIGYSGSTGYVDSPHLHFSVSRYLKNGKMQSLPVKIQTEKGVETKLLKYNTYKKP